MKPAHLILIGLVLLGLPAAGLTGRAVAADSLRNDRYAVELLPSGDVSVRVPNAEPQIFRPRFTVLLREDDPEWGRRFIDRVAKGKGFTGGAENIALPFWKSVRDGKETWDLFEAAASIELTATGATVRDGQIVWSFPADPRFEFTAALSVPANGLEPVLTHRLTPKQPGWFSVGYTGAPEVAAENVAELWQPLIWQERRLPRKSFLSTENLCPLPATLVTRGGVTVGVAADPGESPYRLPTIFNSRFGVALRNAAGRAQPMIFAPVLGMPDSQLPAGRSIEFKVRLSVHAGPLYSAYRALARGLYGFRDYRENVAVSLNETLENMIAYAMNDTYAGWVPELRGFDYTTDVKGSVKVVSSLHPLGLALLTDNPEIYRRRALPIIEFLMSRQKFLFASKPDIKGQGAAHYLRGPAAEVSELAALYLMSQRRSEVFAHYARTLVDRPRTLNLDTVSEAGGWLSQLSLYRMTGDAAYLAKARAGADAYLAERVDRPMTDFSRINKSTGHEFWSDYPPTWIDLLELHDETREPRYLDAILVGARQHTNYVWLHPRIPAGNVTVNRGGVAVAGAYFENLPPDAAPMTAPEQNVPAWRVAHLGLTSEASNTHDSNPATFMATFAAPFLRLAQTTGDDFFRDLARSAVVGRYANFPGYSIASYDRRHQTELLTRGDRLASRLAPFANSPGFFANDAHSTIYSRPDFPLRPLEEITYQSIYYNHVWPMISMVADYLVTDVATRSGGQIDFPSRYAQGYAYLKTRVYGDRPGRFYDEPAARLWLPANLLRSDNVQLNYLAAYGENSLGLAFSNQSAETVETTIHLNPDVVPFDASAAYSARTWRDNRPVAANAVQRGSFRVSVAPHGITAVVIPGLRIQPALLAGLNDPAALPLSPASHAEISTPFGPATGMVLSFGRGLKSAYIWLQASEKELREARLHYRTAGETRTLADARYPYEFSIPLGDAAGDFTFWLEGLTPEGQTVRSAETVLQR